MIIIVIIVILRYGFKAIQWVDEALAKSEKAAPEPEKASPASPGKTGGHKKKA